MSPLQCSLSLIAIFFVVCITPRAAAAEELQLEAVRIEANDDEVRAEGRVRLHLGRCRIRATELRLRRCEGISGQRVRLAAGRAHLEAHRLQIDRSGGLRARFVSGNLCACAEGRPVLSLRARSAKINPEGRRVHLRWPVIDLLGIPVLKLPYLALPLRPGTSGLLAPELGYSGRDGFRLAQGLYLAPSKGDWIDAELSGGWIQKRGARARTRLRIGSGIGAVDLQLEGLHDAQRASPWRGSARGRMVLHGSSLAVAAAPDLISDPQVLKDVDQLPMRVFAPHLRSRLWGWWRWSSLVGTVSNDLYQDLDAPVGLIKLAESSLHGSAEVALSMVPTRLAGPLFLVADSRLVHFYPVVPYEDMESATALSLAPALGLAARLGPIRLSGRGLYRYEALWSALDQRAHLVVGELRASLPLQRNFLSGRLRHLLAPAAGISWIDWETHTKQWSSPDRVRPLVGTAAFGALRTVVWLRRSQAGQGSTHDRTGVLARKLLEAEARLELLQPEDPEEPSGHRVLAGGVLRLRPLRWLRTRTTATWDLTRRELLELQTGICLQRPGGAAISTCAGYHHLRATRMVHLYGSGHLGWASPGADLLALGSVHGDQLFGELQARLGRVTAGIRLAGDPLAGELSYGQVWADLSLGCGCYKVGLRGATRAGQRWPDLMARLTMGWSRVSCD